MESLEDWKDARRKGIGSSDAPSILGLTPWAGALSIWRQKLALEPERPESLPMKIGRQLEPLLAALYAEQHPDREVVSADNQVYVSAVKSFLLATPDYLIHSPQRGHGLLELKTTRAEGDWEADRPSAAALVQLQHQLAVLDRRWGSIAVLIGGLDFRTYDVERDDAWLEEEWLPRAEAFWACVVEQREPLPTAGDLDALKRLHPDVAIGQTIELPADAMQWHLQLEQAEAEEKRWRLVREDAQARFLSALGDAERGTLGGIEYRRLRINVKEEKQPRKAHSYVKLTRGLIGGGR